MLLKSIKLLLDLLFDDNSVTLGAYKTFYKEKGICSIEYTFVIEEKEIIYEFKFDAEKFLSETLICDGKPVFIRVKKSAETFFKENNIYDNVSDKSLFLRRMFFATSFYDDEVLNKWFNFMRQSVYINCVGRYTERYFDDEISIHNPKAKKVYKKEINAFFKEINYKQVIDIVDDNGKNSNLVLFKKDGTDLFISEHFESTGNKTFIELLPLLLHAIDNECIMILDEFSSGLHNELEECLIKYFFHYAKNSQLFFTSHSTNLLNNTILRPDQVYSINFDARKGSYVRRFSDEMPRESQNLEKMYLNGVFDGVPRYNKFFED